MNYDIRTVTTWILLILLGFMFPSFLFCQTQCPADAPNGFTVEEIGDSCYIVFTWPKDEMPELTCGSPGSPLSGSSNFRGKLLNMTLESTTSVYENGSNCSGSVFHFQYHPSLADSYITTRSYCDLTALESVSFVCNRTQGSNFTCDQTNNGPSNAPMPIGLISFKATIEHNETTRLDWITEWEENNKLFLVERSRDGKKFTVISSVDGQGDSNIRQQYRYADFQPMNGVVYYRLKQVDFDGQYSYSNIVTVRHTVKQKWSCFPTVTSDEVQLVNPFPEEKEVVIQTLDIFGNKVLPPLTTSMAEQVTLNLKNLSRGTYILVIVTDDMILNHFRVIKQ